jgi:tape measure domain-containing protein
MAKDAVVGRLVYLLTGDTSELDQSITKSNKKLKNFGQGVKDLGSTLTKSFTLPAAAAGGAAVKFAADLEKQKVAFETLLGDAEKANELFSDLKEFSAETPLQLDDITSGAQKLLAFGSSAEEVQEQLRRLGDIAQGDAQKMDSMIRAFGKIQTRGKATMEELNMVIDAGVPIIQELANGFGVTEEELFKMVSAGKVSFEDFNAAIERMTSSGGQFNGMLEEMSQTTSGKFSTAMDNLKLAAAELGENLLPVVNDILDTITVWARRFGELDEDTQNLILTLGGLVAAIGPVLSIAGTAITTFSTLATTMGIASSALLGPAGLIAATVALGVALGATEEKGTQAEETITGMAGGYKALREAAGHTNEELSEQEQHTQKLREQEDIRRLQHKRIGEHVEKQLADQKDITKELTDQQRIANAYTSYWEQINAQWEEMGEQFPVQRDILERIAETSRLTKQEKLEELEAMKEQFDLSAAMLEQESEYPDTAKAREKLLQKINALMESISEEGEGQVTITGEITDEAHALAGALDEVGEKTEEQTGVWQQLRDALDDYMEQYNASAQDVFNFAEAAYEQAWDLYSTETDLVRNRYEAEISEIERLIERKREEIEARREAGEETKSLEQELQDLQEQKAEQQRTMNAKIWERRKDAQITQTTMAGIQAVVQTWASMGWPWGAAAAAVMAGLYATQVAKMQQMENPYKMAEGGLVQSETAAVIGEAGREAVLPLDDSRAMEAIREGLNGAGGGPVRVTVNLGSKTLYDDFSKATDNGEIRVNPRSVRE